MIVNVISAIDTSIDYVIHHVVFSEEKYKGPQIMLLKRITGPIVKNAFNRLCSDSILSTHRSPVAFQVSCE